MKPSFSYPLSDADRQAASDLLRAGGPLEIGGLDLYPDADGDIIWGVDAYGQDCCAGNHIADVEGALAWVDRQNAPDFHHPAEGFGPEPNWDPPEPPDEEPPTRTLVRGHRYAFSPGGGTGASHIPDATIGIYHRNYLGPIRGDGRPNPPWPWLGHFTVEHNSGRSWTGVYWDEQGVDLSEREYAFWIEGLTFRGSIPTTGLEHPHSVNTFARWALPQLLAGEAPGGEMPLTLPPSPEVPTKAEEALQRLERIFEPRGPRGPTDDPLPTASDGRGLAHLLHQLHWVLPDVDVVAASLGRRGPHRRKPFVAFVAPPWFAKDLAEWLAAPRGRRRTKFRWKVTGEWVADAGGIGWHWVLTTCDARIPGGRVLGRFSMSDLDNDLDTLAWVVDDIRFRRSNGVGW